MIDSLFQGRKQLVAGCVLQIAIVICIGISSGDPVVIPLAVLACVLSAWRYRQTQHYFAERDQYAGTLTEAHRRWVRQWEIRYTISTALTATVLGIVTFVGLDQAESQFTSIASLTLLFSLVPTIVGRLYGSKLLARWSLIGAFSPPFFGFLFVQDILHLTLVLLTLPYAALVFSIMDGVRRPVEHAVRRQYTIGEIAGRFNAALNNMAHGLIMLDEANRVEVINQVARDLFELPEDLDVDGRAYDVLLRHSTVAGRSLEGKRAALRAIFEAANTDDGSRQKLQDSAGRYFEFSVRTGTGRSKVVVVEDITSRVKSVAKIKHLARMDSLTGIPNRSRFETLVNNVLRDHAKKPADVALVVVDLDDFKNINDSIGHLQGDLLLRGVAERLMKIADEHTVISRLGGDEFIVFKHDVVDREDFARELSTKLCGLYRLERDTVKIGVSIGSYFCASDAFELNDAMMNADIALYDAKQNGKGNYSLFNDGMAAKFKHRQMIKNDLQKAVDDDALEVFYQPVIGTYSGKIECAEALCRWTHPQHGPISPAEFIPLAEETGLIWDITIQVLNKACKDCASWPNGVRVSVNLSALDFQDMRIVREIEGALERSGLPGWRLDLEITETAVIRDRCMMEKALGALRENGIKIALDDFGTGQSSLSYLDTLPLDRVKIDRSFVNGIVTDERRRAMLKSITELCHILGKKVTIEGVEDNAHLDLIREEMHSDNIQGWVFSPALPQQAFVDLLSHSYPKKQANSKVS
ncbi:MAG: EAL domain-containing protein [Ahrensia sp.]